jgi:invasion protein IalB
MVETRVTGMMLNNKKIAVVLLIGSLVGLVPVVNAEQAPPRTQSPAVYAGFAHEASAQPYGAWDVRCEPSRRCYIVQTFAPSDDRAFKTTVIIGTEPVKKSFSLKIVTPTGPLLAEGVGLQLDGRNVAKIPFERCGPDACIAELSDAGDIVKDYLTAKNASILVHKDKDSAVFVRQPIEQLGLAIKHAHDFASAGAVTQIVDGSDSVSVVAMDVVKSTGDCNFELASPSAQLSIADVGRLLKDCAAPKLLLDAEGPGFVSKSRLDQPTTSIAASGLPAVPAKSKPIERALANTLGPDVLTFTGRAN